MSRVVLCLLGCMCGWLTVQTQQIKTENAREKPIKDFHSWAITPPMGWNSWDCFGPTVTETEVANATIPIDLKQLGFDSACTITDLWSGKVVGKFSGQFAPVISRHGAGLFKVETKKTSSSKK